MGLDMWLVSRDKKDKRSINNAASYKEEAYWRKFNALHGYIVNNFAEGKDDQKPIFLDEFDLKTIQQVVRDSIKLYSQCVKELLKSDAVFASEYKEWLALKAQEKTANDQYERFCTLEENIAKKVTPLIEEYIFEGASCLKPTSGFFFGSEEFDDYYLSECIRTDKILTSLLKSEDFNKKQFYYTCWW